MSGVSLLWQETGALHLCCPLDGGSFGVNAPGRLLVVRPEGFMRHDWIFDMLSDLHDYACGNDLPELAQQVEETLVTARREIGTEGDKDAPVPIFIRRRAH